MTSVGIIGVGVLGGAMSSVFSDLGISVKLFDKYKGIGKLEDLLSTNIVFLCLPTPFDPVNDCFDKFELSIICNELNTNAYKGIVVIKSTVEPGTSLYFSKIFDKLTIVHNPEFLTARTAKEDFASQKHIVIGETSDDGGSLLHWFYAKHFPHAKISVCTSDESECVKLFCNAFYATKVQYFTEIKLLCDNLNMDYEKIRDMMLKNGWINRMHTDVPGPDGKISYGGMCLPKDTSALLAMMKKTETPYEVLDAVVYENKAMRN